MCYAATISPVNAKAPACNWGFQDQRWQRSDPMPDAALFPTVPLTQEEINGPEIWRPWPFNPRYLAGSCGAVIGLWGRPMKHRLKPPGYIYVGDVYFDGKKALCALHRVLAQTFIPNPFNLPIVRHLNDIKTDNRLINLAWGTNMDNREDSRKNGTSVDRLLPDGRLLCLGCMKAFPASGFYKDKARCRFGIMSRCKRCHCTRRKVAGQREA